MIQWRHQQRKKKTLKRLVSACTTHEDLVLYSLVFTHSLLLHPFLNTILLLVTNKIFVFLNLINYTKIIIVYKLKAADNAESGCHSKKCWVVSSSFSVIVCVSYSLFGIMKWLSKNDANLPSSGNKYDESRGMEERKSDFNGISYIWKFRLFKSMCCSRMWAFSTWFHR